MTTTARETRLHRVADSFIPRLSVAVRLAFARGRKALGKEKPNVDAAVKAIRRSLTDTLPKALRRVYVAGGEVAAGSLKQLRTAKRTTRKIGPFAFRFDATSEEAIAWADRHAAELIDGITETSREAINNAVAEALETGDLRELYDEILAAVGDEDRAELIARTEVMTAANEGQREAWRQAADEGLLAGTERVTWIATPDDRTCPICSDLDGQTRDFDGQYAGGYDGPPAHPRCRCTEGLA